MGGGLARGRAVAAALAVVVVLLGAGTALGALGGGDAASDAARLDARDARQAVAVRVLSTGQGTILRQGSMRIRVRMRRAGALRVFGIARGARPGGRPHTATRSRLVRMRRPGVRVVRLRLTRPGRRIVSDCRGSQLRGGARVRLRGTRRSARVRPGPAERVRGVSESRRCVGGGGDGGPGSPGAGVPGAGGQPGGGTGPSGGGGSGSGDPEPLGELDTADADRCDFLDPSVCLYPFPNDHFTTPDESTDTGLRLDIDPLSTPQNQPAGGPAQARPIDPADQNRADGFSPGNTIITKVPGLDSREALDRTGAAPITDMEQSLEPDQPVTVIDTESGEPHLIWAEIDANPEDPEDVTLIIRPGTNFEEGRRYIVALSDLKNAEGGTIEPREEFRAYRDDILTENADIEARRAHYEELFATLGDAGIERGDLYLTWDFTVASEDSLAGRALTIRDDAFSKLGDEDLENRTVEGTTPTFVQGNLPPEAVEQLDRFDPGLPVGIGDIVGGRQDIPPCGTDGCQDGESDTTARVITGQLRVPCYLDSAGCAPGGKFLLDGDGDVLTTGAAASQALANVICTIPRQAVDGGAASPVTRPSLYGHGLLGSAGEVRAGNVQRMGEAHGFTWCATDWAGMSTLDVPNVIKLLQDLSDFNTLVDRIQQGYVNFMYLGRWMIHPQGASANEGFKVDGRSVIDTRELFYDGNSQGGILSGGLTALSPDVSRSVHGVPGMNYSTLLRRSVDFDMYAEGEVEGQQLPAGGLYQNYPDELERPLILSLMQLLWDRGEANGYAHHMTDDPLPNSPPGKSVLLHPAYGDHQVAVVSAEVEARTIGASAYQPALYEERSPDEDLLFGLDPTPLDGSFTGSALVYWDSGPPEPENCETGEGTPDCERGTPAPPTENVPPRRAVDPHGHPRADAKAMQQKSDFLQIDGRLTNPCTFAGVAIPCYSDGFTGPTP